MGQVTLDTIATTIGKDIRNRLNDVMDEYVAFVHLGTRPPEHLRATLKMEDLLILEAMREESADRWMFETGDRADLERWKLLDEIIAEQRALGWRASSLADWLQQWRKYSPVLEEVRRRLRRTRTHERSERLARISEDKSQGDR